MAPDTRPSTGTVDFSGSEVASTEVETGALRLRFAALNLRSSSLYLQRVELVLLLADEWSPPAGCLGRLSRGGVSFQGSRVVLQVPSELRGALELELEFANGSYCLVRGDHLTLRQHPGAGSAEHLHC